MTTTPDELHAQMLADLRFAYEREGVPQDILVGSDHWYRLKIIAREMVPVLGFWDVRR